MADELIRIEGIQELMALIKRISDLEPVKDAVKVAAIYLKGRIAIYPAQKRLSRESVYGATFKSDKQRRYFFAALKKGEIESPYRRGESPGSETFGRRWTINTENYGLRAIVGNNANYGPLLMDEERQSLYARAVGWRTMQAIVKDERDKLVGIVSDGLQRAMKAK